MRLLKTYARTAWQEAVRTGQLAPIAERHLGELLGALCAASAGALPVRGDPAIAAARLAGLREVLARRFAEPSLSMRVVASAVGLSERAGYLAFEQAGASFSDELHTLRLQHARERLRTQPGRRVVDVAFEVGFSDASHFYRLFRRRFGCTPGDVRHH